MELATLSQQDPATARMRHEQGLRLKGVAYRKTTAQGVEKGVLGPTRPPKGWGRALGSNRGSAVQILSGQGDAGEMLPEKHYIPPPPPPGWVSTFTQSEFEASIPGAILSREKRGSGKYLFRLAVMPHIIHIHIYIQRYSA